MIWGSRNISIEKKTAVGFQGQMPLNIWRTAMWKRNFHWFWDVQLEVRMFFKFSSILQFDRTLFSSWNIKLWCTLTLGGILCHQQFSPIVILSNFKISRESEYLNLKFLPQVLQPLHFSRTWSHSCSFACHHFPRLLNLKSHTSVSWSVTIASSHSPPVIRFCWSLQFLGAFFPSCWLHSSVLLRLQELLSVILTNSFIESRSVHWNVTYPLLSGPFGSPNALSVGLVDRRDTSKTYWTGEWQAKSVF